MIPLDLEVEKTRRSIQRENIEAQWAKEKLEEEKTPISYETKAIKRKKKWLFHWDKWWETTAGGLVLDIFLWDFNLLTLLLLMLRIMCFQIWEITRSTYKLLEICESIWMCKPYRAIDDQIKLRLFKFSLVGIIKYWL